MSESDDFEFNPTITAGARNDELLEELERVAEEIGRTPTTDDVDEYGEYGSSQYQTRFGTFNNALEKIGHEPNDRDHIPDGELLEELQRLADELGRTPTKDDMKTHGKFTQTPYYTNFGSWNNALRMVGLDVILDRDGKREVEKRMGPNWDKISRVIRKRDESRCRVCGIHETEVRRLHVHHITPRREFLEDGDPKYGLMNRPDNLITVCPDCHRKVERKFEGYTPDIVERRAREELEYGENPIVESLTLD